MEKKKYNLVFLPIFEKDLLEVVEYISSILKNQRAAYKLIDDIELAINKRLQMPLSFEPYHSYKLRKYPYYRIKVKKFYIFYVVIENTMEVRRLIYAKRNVDEMLK